MNESAVSAPGRVKAVSVIRTGTGDVHREHIFGTRKPALFWIFFTRRAVRIPVHAFAIEHERGLVLFDTGMDRAVITNPDYWPDKVTAFFMDHIFEFHQDPEEILINQLRRAGYEPVDVVKAVLSHLHFDHVGGIRDIPQAELFVSREEWEHMLEKSAEQEGILRREIDIPGARWNKIDFQAVQDPSLAPFTECCDLMGDGSLMLLPTPGHTPGSLSMLVKRTDAPPLLLIGDLAYSAGGIEQNRMPGTGDKRMLNESYRRVRGLKDRHPDLLIVPSHDWQAAEAL